MDLPSPSSANCWSMSWILKIGSFTSRLKIWNPLLNNMDVAPILSISIVSLNHLGLRTRKPWRPLVSLVGMQENDGFGGGSRGGSCLFIWKWIIWRMEIMELGSGWNDSDWLSLPSKNWSWLKDSATSIRNRLAWNSNFSTQAMLALLILNGSKRNPAKQTLCKSGPPAEIWWRVWCVA